MSNANQSPRLPTAAVAKNGRPGAPASNKLYRRRFSNYLLNKGLQLRYIGMVTFLSAVISGSLGYLIWVQERMASAQVRESLRDYDFGDCGTPKECSEIKESIGATLQSHDSNVVLKMLGVGVGLVVVLGLYLLVMTHKVAGPLHKISLYFDRMAEGRLAETYPLRRGDMLQDFYDDFKAMHDAVRSRFQAENEVWSRVLEACDAAGVARKGELGAALDQLEDLHKDRAKTLA